MSTPLDKYLKTASDGPDGAIFLDDWNGLVSEIGSIIADFQVKAAGFDAVSQTAIEVLLARINSVLGPAYDAVTQKAALVQALYDNLNGQGVSADVVLDTVNRVLVSPVQRDAIGANSEALATILAGAPTDLNTFAEVAAAKLDITAKASTADAQTATDNTKYMTAAAVAVEIAALGAFVKKTVFTTGGTFTKDPRTKRIFVECVGAGGAGGASGGSAANAVGGCGGSYSSVWLDAALVGANETVLIGAGGTSVSATAGGVATGNAGGPSSFGTWIKALGGSGGLSISPAMSLLTTATGTNQSATVLFPMGTDFGPGSSSVGSDTLRGGAGGGGVASGIPSGAGTSILHGNGGAGTTGTTAAAAGAAPGGGGGATARSNLATALSGAGARGEVRVWEFG